MVALSGESEWVRNVRAARGQAVIRRGVAQNITLKEVPVDERSPVIRQYLRRGGWLSTPDPQARHYFGLGRDPSLAEIRSVADRYPVFQITAAGPDSGRKTDSSR